MDGQRPCRIVESRVQVHEANADIYTFKSGVVDGKRSIWQVTEIASLPSKEELISKLLYVINAQAQRLVTVINAVPRDLAVVIKQIGDKAPAGAPAAEEPKAEAAAPAEAEAPAAEVQAEETPAAEPEAPVEAAEEAQQTSEEAQNAESPEAEQAAEAEEEKSE